MTKLETSGYQEHTCTSLAYSFITNYLEHDLVKWNSG